MWRVGALAPALVLLGACRFGAPAGASEQGRDLANLYHLMFYAAIAVAAVVYSLILWSVVRYRRRRDDDGTLPPQFRFNVPVEVLYTLIPIGIVVWLFIETYSVERPIDRIDSDPAVVVEVTAFQWQWRFQYPDEGIDIVGSPGLPEPRLVLPVGETVQVRLHSPDVIHAFFIPEFLFKRDAIPGERTRFDLVIPREGVFRGECAEFCGLEHADMNFVLQAVSPAEFERWVAEQQAAA
jgi:cytochrome c oxidase subunit 2